MALQSARPALLSALAIFFGVVQVLCTCANAKAAIPAEEAAHVEHQVEANCGLAHSISDLSHQAEQEEDPGTDHDHSGDHQHDVDCAHCDGASVLVVANGALTPVALPSLADEEFMAPLVCTLPVTRAHMVPTALDGLRWLHPPSSTLVTLKIRLTI